MRRRGSSMFIEIHELQDHHIDFEEKFASGVVDFGPDITQTSDLKTSGRAQLVQEIHDKRHKINDIRLDGKLSTQLELACARCLKPVSQDVAREFRSAVSSARGRMPGKEELSVTAAEAEVSYYQGEGLAARRRAARAGFAGAPVESALPRGLQGPVPTLRQESEPGSLLLR